MDDWKRCTAPVVRSLDTRSIREALGFAQAGSAAGDSTSKGGRTATPMAAATGRARIWPLVSSTTMDGPDSDGRLWSVDSAVRRLRQRGVSVTSSRTGRGRLLA